MSSIKTSFLIALFPLLWVLLPGTVFAAFDLITFSTTPKTPGANESVLVTMNSYAVNLGTANITWYVNKEPIKNGTAETSLTLRTGDFGEKVTIDVVIITTEGLTVNKQFIIAPAEVDMLWEAQTYTPPFYKGKALPTYKSLVRVIAIPRFNSVTSSPAKYFYKWTYDRNKGAGEAIGKNSIVIPVGYAGSPTLVDVETSLPGTDWKGAQYLSIPVFTTKLAFYQQAPLLGTLYTHALNASTETSGVEFTAHAVPYFFSLNDVLDGNILYQWSVNKQNRPASSDPLNFTLVKSGNKQESQTISLSAQNPKRILQSGATQAMVSFTSEE